MFQLTKARDPILGNLSQKPGAKRYRQGTELGNLCGPGYK